MKKIMFLMVLAALALPVNAENWQYVVTDNPNVTMYIDMDSVKYLNSEECVYAVKLKAGEKPEKAVYLKSSPKKLGVIRVEDFEAYSPKAVFSNPHAFMKSPLENPLLISAHNYMLNLMSIDKYETAPLMSNEKLVSYINDNDEYTFALRKELENNWEPPVSGRNTQAVIVLTIGNDGSLLDYNFAQPSGDESTDRSIISAVEKSAPFARFSKTTSKNCQFVFDYKYFKKSVQ